MVTRRRSAGPRLVEADGTLDFSQRRFSRLSATWSQALFLNRIFPQASWSDDVVRQAMAYETGRSAEWLSGACLLVRREALEQLDGWDETFFLYCEDMDLCRRLQQAGWDVRYVADAECTHEGGRRAREQTSGRFSRRAGSAMRGSIAAASRRLCRSQESRPVS